MTYMVNVEYEVTNTDSWLDEQLNKVTGKSSASCGTWLGSRPLIRDMQWFFDTKEEADKVAAKMQQIPGVSAKVEEKPV